MSLYATCPGECGTVLPETVFEAFADEPTLAKYKKFQLDDFVSHRKRVLRPCPRAGCHMYVSGHAGDEVRVVT